MLAVSDPAADVTSTQTWRAVADGRSTGIWTAPPDLRDGAAGAAPGSSLAAPPGRPGAAPPTRQRRHGNGSPPGAADPATSTGPSASVGTGPNPRVSSGSSTGVGTGPNPRVSTGPNPRVSTGPNPRVSTGPNRVSTGTDQSTAADAISTDETAAGGRRRAGRRTKRPRGRRSVSVMLALAAASLLVLGAVGTLVYTVLHNSPKPRLTDQPTSKRRSSASPGAGTGPYGDIVSRQTDPQPLTLAELFPASFNALGVSMTSVATNLSSDCASALVGAKLQSAVGAAGCTQVARATYVDAPGSLMGTIGVLNLSTGDAAKTAAASADANDFISQLTASSGPAQTIGQGTGIEEALAKGHYLILIWAEFSNFSTPTAQNSNLIETFMTVLLDNTANRDLTTRMLTGSP